MSKQLKRGDARAGWEKRRLLGRRRKRERRREKRVDEEDSKDGDYGPHLMLVMRSFDTQFN